MSVKDVRDVALLMRVIDVNVDSPDFFRCRTSFVVVTVSPSGSDADHERTAVFPAVIAEGTLRETVGALLAEPIVTVLLVFLVSAPNHP